MASQTVDVIDGPVVENIVFDSSQSEKSSWKFCNSTTLPRSEVVFFFQAITLLIVIITCLGKLMLDEVTTEEKPLWVSLLSGAVGYILPSLHL